MTLKTWFFHLFALVIIAFTSCVCATATPSPTDAQNTARLIERFEATLKPRYGTSSEDPPQWTLRERMDHHNVPALSIAVAIDGELKWAKAYGETRKGSGQKVNSNTLFQAASLSKPVASVALLKLVSSGKLDLDKPVNDFLTSWQIPVNDYNRNTPVTLRHLLSHRAGTTIHGFRGYKPAEPIPTSKQILQGIPPANTEPVVVNQKPGTAYRYSGGGFQIAQLLAEDVTEQDFANWVERAVFAPLSLTRSNYRYPQSDPNSAIGHTGEDASPIPGSGFIYPELAAAALWTTPSELVAIGNALAKDRTGGTILLPQEIVRQLIPDTANEAGLGFGLNNDGDGVAFVHNGHNPGFSARWINYADGRASVAVLTNSDSGGELIREVLSALGHIYGWKQDAYVERHTINLDASWTDKLVGDYYFDLTSSTPAVSIWVENNKLWIEGLLTDRSRLFPVSSSAFFIASGLNMTLVNDDNDQPGILDIEGELQLVKSGKRDAQKH